MSAPALGPLHERLAALAGSWAGTEELAESPWAPAGTAEATMRFAVGAGGFCVTEDYESRRDGAVALSGHGVLSVDPATGDVLHHWFDSIGYPPLEPARGAFEGDALVVSRSSDRGTNRTTLTLRGDVLEQEIAFTPAGVDEALVLVLGRYRRY